MEGAGKFGRVRDAVEEIFVRTDDLMEEEEIDDDDDDKSSVDLLIRFLQSMFNKFSNRAKKASRSVLPSSIPPQLVAFAVDGVFPLASLSILRALLELFQRNCGSTAPSPIDLSRGAITRSHSEKRSRFTRSRGWSIYK